MATSTDDMSTPVTRGELRDELQQLEVRLEQKLEQKTAHLVTRTEFEMWGGALLARIELGEQRIFTELARHTRAIQESMSTQISVIDDKYDDLPARVSQLEATVFLPEQR
jgi:hypothetical protein